MNLLSGPNTNTTAHYQSKCSITVQSTTAEVERPGDPEWYS